MDFPCTKCGSCCMRAGVLNDELKKVFGEVPAELAFPYKAPNGRCEKLNDDMTCAVYDSRPTVCNIRKMFTIISKDSIEKFYRLNADACNKMQVEDGKAEEYRVTIKN